MSVKLHREREREEYQNFASMIMNLHKASIADACNSGYCKNNWCNHFVDIHRFLNPLNFLTGIKIIFFFLKRTSIRLVNTLQTASSHKSVDNGNNEIID